MRTAIANNKWYFSLGGGIIGHSVDDDDDSPVLSGWMDGWVGLGSIRRPTARITDPGRPDDTSHSQCRWMGREDGMGRTDVAVAVDDENE